MVRTGRVELPFPCGSQILSLAASLLFSPCSTPCAASQVRTPTCISSFQGSAGATATQPLVGGVNVRDYNNDGGQNTINTSTVQAWTNGEGQRLDRQEYILPAEFASQTLTSVTITDAGDRNSAARCLSGLTVSTCRAYVTETIAISSSGVTLVNKSAATACFAPIGSPFVEALPEGSNLAPNTTAIVKLGFSDPSGTAISYTPLVAGSLGGAP
jgi:hypothetical protein